MATPLSQQPWYQALMARSRGMNQQYGLPKKKAPATPVSTPISPEEFVQQLIQKEMAARLGYLEEDRQSALARLKEQSDLELARGKELAAALQQLNLPGRIQQIYGGAASDIGNLAQGFSGTLRDTATADAANQARMLSGTGQEGAVRNAGEAMGNVTYGVGGYLPARSLGEAGAAFGSQAALEPSFAMRIAAQNAFDVDREGRQTIEDDFTSARNEINAGRFDLEQELLGQYQDQKLAQQKFLQDQSNEQYDRYKEEREFYFRQEVFAAQRGDKAAAEKWRKKGYELDQRQQTRLENKDQGLDANGNLLPGYTRGPKGQIIPPGYKVDANGNVVKKSTAKAAKNPRVAARKNREDDFRSASLEAVEEAQKMVTPGEKVAGVQITPDQRPSYQVAYQRLWNRYKHLLRYASAGGQSKIRARIDKMIKEALIEAGWPTPGQSHNADR